VYGGRRCRCGALGCLEAYVGAEAVVTRLAEATGRTADPGLLRAVLVDDGALPAAAVVVLQETVGYLGAGIASLINLFNPERIVLGGWAGLALGGRFLPEIRESVARHAVATGAATLPVATLLAAGGRPAAPAVSFPRRHRGPAGHARP
jgi:predicted NBD/HSP70 family sugar kinase